MSSSKADSFVNAKVPTLEGGALEKIHFGRRLPEFADDGRLYVIRSLSESVGLINFPLPPHRKTVYDIIFITKGSSVRSKGLTEYHCF